MLSLNGISKWFGQHVLFSQVTFNVNERDRIALIGPNGCGKSTLLDIIAGGISPDAGLITRRKGLTIGYVRQDRPMLSSLSLLEEVLSAAKRASSLERRIVEIHKDLTGCHKEYAQAQLLEELGVLQQRYEAFGGYNIEHEACLILAGLGFSEAEYGQKVSVLSGGWQVRVEIAKTLLQKPDLLLLDEPTNHLDLDTQKWFEEFIRSYAGAVLLTSHDRAFLNKVVNRVISINNGSITAYVGNYDKYVDARNQELEILEGTVRRQNLEIEKEERFINRFRYKASKASLVQSRIKKLCKTTRIEVPRLAPKIRFRFPEPPHSATDVLILSNIVKAYGEKTVYRDLNLRIKRGERVAIVGPNGAGKTTLLKIMAGKLPFDYGERKLGQSVVCAYYAQQQLEDMLPDNSVLVEARSVCNQNLEDTALRSILGGFLFSGDDVCKKVEVLSGGEKARLALAKMLIQPANFLLLDEPTNHLDIISREILADALESYKGTLCFITHDRTLIQQIATSIIEVVEGKVSVFPGEYDSYLYHKELLAKTEKESIDSPAEATSVSGMRQKRVLAGRLRNEYGAVVAPLNNRISEIENEIEQVEMTIKSLEEAFSLPDYYKDPQEAVSGIENYRNLVARLKELSLEWETLSRRVEGLREELRDSIGRLGENENS